MVTQFGMSDVVGPVAVGDREAEIFLGREVVQRREISDSTAEVVDREVRRILSEAFERARTILTANREDLDRLTFALLERETLDREDVETLMAGKPLPPLVSGAAPAPERGSRERAAAVPPPVLGNPPPEPAGA
jgi:cell division protease FtsH